jgi:hypothetical protein
MEPSPRGAAHAAANVQSANAPTAADRAKVALATSYTAEATVRTMRPEAGKGVPDDTPLEVSLLDALDPSVLGARVSMAVADAVIAEDAIKNMTRSDEHDLAAVLTDQYGEHLVMAVGAGGTVRVHTDHGVFDVEEPDGVKGVKASKDKAKWLESMQIEVDTIEGNETYHLRQKKDLPPHTRIFKLAWKLKIKRNGDGTIDKRKARLVLMGNMLTKGRHYADTFAIGARLASVKIVFAVCAVMKWEFDFMLDISGAYLNAWRPSSGPGSWIVSNQPELFEKRGPNGEELFAVHDKYLYGDPASGRAWQHLFDAFLSDSVEGVGATCTTTDTNLFSVHNEHGHAVFAKHVDEIIGVADRATMRDFVVDRVTSRFKVSLVGKWQTVLGFSVKNHGGRVTMGAERHIKDGVAKYLEK